jgi:hypothetical protein
VPSVDDRLIPIQPSLTRGCCPGPEPSIHHPISPFAGEWRVHQYEQRRDIPYVDTIHVAMPRMDGLELAKRVSISLRVRSRVRRLLTYL